MDIIGPIFWLIVALGLLVTFHEYGHFWVARRCGVRVLRFSVGFGSALWSRTARDGTEYRLAAIPLGGYVKMLDEREGPVAPEQRDAAFNRKPVGQRIAIVAAGPIFNLIFAVAAFWLMFVIGISETRPVLNPPTGMAAEAGLQEDDLILEVDGEPVQTWTHTLLRLIPPSLDRRSIELTVADLDGNQRQIELPLAQLGADFDEENTLESLGLVPWRPDFDPVIGEVSAASPASRAGLSQGDRITAIDGIAVAGWRDIIREIGARAVNADGSTNSVTLALERGGREWEVAIEPEIRDGRPLLGIGAPPPDESLEARFDRSFFVLQMGPVEAIGASVNELGRLTGATLGILGRMITGTASLSNLSGPITIAQMADSSARLGLSRFLFFLGLISLSLAIINLLPIPMLDGGHLLYYFIEIIKGSPVSEQLQVAGQYVGLLLVVSLMSLAIFNDILRVFT
jgi:regulator of sigma E protease